MVAVADEHLLTPRGLRSLSPQDPAYRSHYHGDPWSRDGANHQGIVWDWLIGPFITALCRVHGDVEERQRAYTAQLDALKHDITALRTDAFKQLSDMRVPVMTCGPSHSALHTTNVRDDGRIN